jgi:glucose/arabinose dehydrogenase
LVSIDPTASAQKFAYGLSSKAPAQPANNRSTFNVHSSFGNYKIDLSKGQNAEFDTLVAANLVNDIPSVPTSVLVPTSSMTLQPTTLSTSATTSAAPQPTQTSVPSFCADVPALAFPVEVAKGWKVTKVAGGLTQPRGMVSDAAGNLLVVQNGLGISAHKVGPDGCFTSSKTLIAQRNLNHGIALSLDGKTLYVSSATSVFAWSYDSVTLSVSNTSTTLITGMDNTGHVTRTLAIPPNHPNLLLVSHGSNDNFDYGSADIKTARSCIKVFDTTKVSSGGYDYVTEGYQMGYGLRNEVGLAFDGNGM